jgi:hypothetical protein
VEERVELPSGVKVRATYHFNRNALAAACLTEVGLLAVTDSGNMLRFDLKDFRLRQEVRPDAAITRLVKVEGIGVAAARTDGRVFRVDPQSLAMTEFAKLPTEPNWMASFRDRPDIPGQSLLEFRRAAGRDPPSLRRQERGRLQTREVSVAQPGTCTN